MASIVPSFHRSIVPSFSPLSSHRKRYCIAQHWTIILLYSCIDGTQTTYRRYSPKQQRKRSQNERFYPRISDRFSTSRFLLPVEPFAVNTVTQQHSDTATQHRSNITTQIRPCHTSRLQNPRRRLPTTFTMTLTTTRTARLPTFITSTTQCLICSAKEKMRLPWKSLDPLPRTNLSSLW